MFKHFSELEQQSEEVCKHMQKAVNRISFIRLLLFCVAAILIIVGIVDKHTILTWIGGFVAIAFLVMVGAFYKQQMKLHYEQLHRNIIKRYLARLSQEWGTFSEDGKEFLAGTGYENIAIDLDLFGPRSLFQYLCVAKSAEGKSKLASYLSKALGAQKEDDTITDIVERQNAVRELVSKEEEALRLEAFAEQAVEHNKIEAFDRKVLSSGSSKEQLQSKVLIIVAGVSVAALMITAILGALQVVSLGVSGFLLLWQLVASQLLDGILFAKSSEAYPIMQKIAAYEPFMREAVQMDVDSERLKEIQTNFATQGKNGIRYLRRVKELLNVRYNPILYFCLNMLVFYNVFVYASFLKWQKKYGQQALSWLDDCAELEALLSLAVIGRTKEEYCYPTLIKEKKPYVQMINMCHPLLEETEVVGNDVTLDQQIRLVTGSNMSGKTTYLRTLGVNAVLAYAGAPVCAKEATICRMHIFSSMRVVDDVNHGISTFYAEVLRIKSMITFLEQEETMLVLIDEIFKGTNSADRIVGAKGVIEKLCTNHVCGMVSTHDFELCELAKQQDMLANYHFNEYFKEDELSFDYLVKEGRCTTTNALHILKMAGIDTSNR